MLPQLRDFSGYVLAGGQSSRMGRDKALIELAGKPLIEHAVIKLKRVCADVAISSSNPLLGAHAPLISDVHPGCGPIGGMEAALLQTSRDWNLFLPVDVPFLPTVYLHGWLSGMEVTRMMGMRAMIFTVNGEPQPTVALVHRDVGPLLGRAIERGEYKLLLALKGAAQDVSKRAGFAFESGFWEVPYWAEFESTPQRDAAFPEWFRTREAQRRYSAHWFDNLNTPEEFAEAERNVNALDT